MLILQHKAVGEHLFRGTFGLERETLRVTSEGYMAHTPHPFADDPFIVKDFCENQAEINTGVHTTAKGVISELTDHTRRLYLELDKRGELLWMFSNPPYIRGEDDIPIALYDGAQYGKQSYRVYLAEKYGKYKMTLSGIHVNYSFDDELLRSAFDASEQSDFTVFKNSVYLSLAQSLAAYGWILNLLLSASPLCDGSYLDPHRLGQDVVTGDASIRCSFHGYWNLFTPILDYRDILSYAESIQRYIANGMLSSVGELYYPIRLKPRGSNRINALVQNGVNHIEIRNVDLNPFAPAGIDERDLSFIELLMIYLAVTDGTQLSRQEQLLAIENFKCAARLDIDRECVRVASGPAVSVRQAGLTVLRDMQAFFRSSYFTEEDSITACGLIDYQIGKLTQPGARYAERVIDSFSGGYVAKGLQHIIATNRSRQETGSFLSS